MNACVAEMVRRRSRCRRNGLSPKRPRTVKYIELATIARLHCTSITETQNATFTKFKQNFSMKLCSVHDATCYVRPLAATNLRVEPRTQ
jgi:hypothetical protein